MKPSKYVTRVSYSNMMMTDCHIQNNEIIEGYSAIKKNGKCSVENAIRNVPWVMDYYIDMCTSKKTFYLRN